MEYRKQHGKLPDDLTFLPEIPRSKLDHLPLMYEKTENGFWIFFNTEEGKKPDFNDRNHSSSFVLKQQLSSRSGEMAREGDSAVR